jgi:hypothetical protein
MVASEEGSLMTKGINPVLYEAKPPKQKMDAETFQTICIMISQGLSANVACDEMGLSSRGFWAYMATASEDELLVYSKSIRTRSLSFADRIDDVVRHVTKMAEGVHTGEVEPSTAAAIFQAGKLAIEAYKWTASRLMPNVYGETQHVNMAVSSHGQHLQALKDLTERGRQKLIARGVEPQIEDKSGSEKTIEFVPARTSENDGVKVTGSGGLDTDVPPVLPYKHPRDDDPPAMPGTFIRERFIGETGFSGPVKAKISKRIAEAKEIIKEE